MKKQLLTLTVLLWSGLSLFAQSKYSVNNDPNYSADYSDLQEAINSVPSGSTLIVQGSTQNYGDIVINKPIVIFGPGYNQTEVPDTSSQANKSMVFINTIKIDSLGSGTIISGIYTPFTLKIENTSNVSIIGCLFGRDISVTYSSNILISRNRRIPNVFNGEAFKMWGDGTNVIIKNNIVTLNGGQIISTDLANGDHVGPSVVFENNTVEMNDPAGGCEFRIYKNGQITVRNNIFINTGTNPTNQASFSKYIWGSFIDNYLFENNISSDSSFSGTPGMMNNVTLTSLFQNYGNMSYGDEWQFQTIGSSPAIGYGTNGVTCGAYGGNNPYRIGGKNLIPNIYEMEVAPVGSNTQGLNIQIKAKANK